MNNEQPKISVITVCYNEPAENIQLTFDSISSQSYANKEWIVVDGGSRVETIEAINAYSTRIDRFVSEPDNGIYDAMNKGLRLATGDFVIFMNTGDCFCSADTLEVFARHMGYVAGYDCYFGDVVLMRDGQHVVSQKDKVPSRFFFYHSAICHQSMFARLSLFSSVGKFDTKYELIADRDWANRAVTAGATWKYIAAPVCLYDESGASSDVRKRLAERKRFINASYSLSERSVYYVTYLAIRVWRKLRMSLTAR